jgi:hypothetical protein
MSVLSLPFDKLNRLHLAIRLHQTPGSLSFSLESISPSELPPNPVSRDQPSNNGESYCMNFQTGHDDRGPVLKIFSSCVENPTNATTTPTNATPTQVTEESSAPSAASTSAASSSDYSLKQSPSHASVAPTSSTEEYPAMFASAANPAPVAPVIADGLFDAEFFGQNFDNGAMPFGSLLSCLDTTMHDNPPPEMEKNGFMPPANDQRQPFNWNDDSFLQSLDLNVDPSCHPTPRAELPESLFSEDWLLTPPSSVTSLSSSASSSASSRYSSPASDVADLPAPSDSATSAAAPAGKRHERYDRRRFPCPIPDCNRRFTSQYTLKVHVKAHRPKPRPCFPCTLGCNEQFSRQHDRLRHEVAKHRKVCEWSCGECGRFFSSSKTLGNHKCKLATGKNNMRWMGAPATSPAPVASS